MNCLVKHITEDKIKGRRWKQLLDDLKEIRECYKLKEEALERIVWRNGLKEAMDLL
jgi:hypothetical protein